MSYISVKSCFKVFSNMFRNGLFDQIVKQHDLSTATNVQFANDAKNSSVHKEKETGYVSNHRKPKEIKD